MLPGGSGCRPQGPWTPKRLRCAPECGPRGFPHYSRRCGSVTEPGPGPGPRSVLTPSPPWATAAPGSPTPSRALWGTDIEVDVQ